MDRINELQQRLLDSDLDELLGAGPAPNLIEAVRRRAREQELIRSEESALPVSLIEEDDDIASGLDSRNTGRSTAGAAMSPSGPGPSPRQGKLITMPNWADRLGKIAAVAGMATGFGLLGHALFFEGKKGPTRPANAPRTMAEAATGLHVAPGARLVGEDGERRLVDGWALMSGGAPRLRVDQDRIDVLSGRLVTRAGARPSPAELLAIRDQIKQTGIILNEKEETMLLDTKQWVVRGGAALCLLGAAALVNDTMLAQDSGEAKAMTGADLFTHFDKNGDGFVGKDECKDQDIVVKADTDGDGKASKREFEDSFASIRAAALEYVTENVQGEVVETVTTETEITEVQDGEERRMGVEALFAMFDKNKDGNLDLDELSASLPGATPEIAKKFLAKLDANSDGIASREEVEKAIKDGKGDFLLEAEEVDASELEKDAASGFSYSDGRTTEAIFADLDKDGNKLLSMKEIEAFGERNEYLKKLDADNDGFVSYQEFMTAKPADGKGLKIELKGASVEDIMKGFKNQSGESASKSIFEAFDKNKNGKLDKDEYPAQEFGLMDLNGDGAVSLDEFLKHSSPREQESAQKEAFRKLDENGDGRVDGWEIRKLIELLDTDGDGALSEEEFLRFPRMKK